MDKEVLDIRPQTTTNQVPAKHSQSVPLLDIAGENAALHDEFCAAANSVLKSGQFVLGPEVTALEQEIAAFCDVPHAVGCASGSDALLLALMACDVGPGDEVIVPSFTFFATASAVSRLGATPVFADIDPASFNATAASLEAALTPQTRAVIIVHLYGQCAEMPAIVQLCETRGLTLVEDCAQAIGADYDGRAAGSWGAFGCFSFYPTKNLGAYGDAGLVTVRDAAERKAGHDELAALLKRGG